MVVVGIDGKPSNKCITAHRTYLLASNDVKVILEEKKIGILISHYALFRVIFPKNGFSRGDLRFEWRRDHSSYRQNNNHEGTSDVRSTEEGIASQF